jgi:hypothetical protein
MRRTSLAKVVITFHQTQVFDMRLRHAVFAAVVPMFLTAERAVAQESSRPVKFGILAGMSMSDFSESGLSGALLESSGVEKRRRKGGQIGAFVTFPLGRYFALQPEMHYVQKGAIFEFSGDGNFPGEDPEPLPFSAEATLRLAYLEIPLLARLDLGSPDAELRPFLLAGPTLALRAACQYAFEIEDLNAQFECDESDEVGVELEDSTDPVKKVDYGMMLGGGVAIRIFGLPASLQARYSRSLSSISREVSGVVAPDVRNTTFSFLVGIGF